MPRLIEVICLYELPAPLVVTGGCFSKSVDIKIGELTGKAILPVLEWVNDEPRIHAPAMQANLEKHVKHYGENANEGWEKWHYWGKVGGWNSKKQTIIYAYVHTLLLNFKLPPDKITYSDYLHGRGHPQGPVIQSLFLGADQWFERLRTWIEAAIDQDTDPIDPITSVEMPGNNLRVLTAEGDIISLPASANTIVAKLNSYDNLKLPLLRKIAKHANGGAMPSDAHLLLRDSKAALRRNHYRRAVIDAGSATEIALADFNNRVTHIHTGTRLPTLGWYVNQSTIAARVSIPTNAQTDLVTVRNDAIHQNIIPTRDQTVRAISITKYIVDRVDPLPL